MMSGGESAHRITKRHNCRQMIQCVKFASRLVTAAIRDTRNREASLVQEVPSGNYTYHML